MASQATKKVTKMGEEREKFWVFLQVWETAFEIGQEHRGIWMWGLVWSTRLLEMELEMVGFWSRLGQEVRFQLKVHKLFMLFGY